LSSRSECVCCVHAHPSSPPSFPTRRSSDLRTQRPHHRIQRREVVLHRVEDAQRPQRGTRTEPVDGQGRVARPVRGLLVTVGSWRSEEHTSELQSRENLVCRLLLEKKKKTHS